MVQKQKTPTAPSTSSMLHTDAAKLQVTPHMLVEGMSLVGTGKQTRIVRPNRAERRAKMRGRGFRRVYVPEVGLALIDPETGSPVFSYAERVEAHHAARGAKTQARQARPAMEPSSTNVPATSRELSRARAELRRSGVMA